MGFPPSIPFVYFSIGVNIFLVLSLSTFGYQARLHRKSISKYHDTISSFCANRNSWQNRYLLAFCIAVSLNSLALHFEEFNSRGNEGMIINVLFFVEIGGFLLMPCIGIFYTRGNDPNNQNTHYICTDQQWIQIPIKYSTFFHQIGSYSFVFLILISNSVYIWKQVIWDTLNSDTNMPYTSKEQYTNDIFFILDIFLLLFVLVFFLFNGMYINNFCKKCRCLCCCNCGRNNRSPLIIMDNNRSDEDINVRRSNLSYVWLFFCCF